MSHSAVVSVAWLQQLVSPLLLIVLLVLLAFLSGPHSCEAALAQHDCYVNASQRTQLAKLAENVSGCLLQYEAPTHYCQACAGAHERWVAGYASLSAQCQRFGAFRKFHESLMSNSTLSGDGGGVDSHGGGGDSLWLKSGCLSCDTSVLRAFNSLLCDFYTCVGVTATACEEKSLSMIGAAAVDTNRAFAAAAAPTATATAAKRTLSLAWKKTPNSSSDCSRCDGNFTAAVNYFDSMTAACKGNADVVDQYRRVLYFWADRNCASTEINRNVMYIVITLLVGVPISFYWMVYVIRYAWSLPPIFFFFFALLPHIFFIYFSFVPYTHTRARTYIHVFDQVQKNLLTSSLLYGSPLGNL